MISPGRAALPNLRVGAPHWLQRPARSSHQTHTRTPAPDISLLFHDEAGVRTRSLRLAAAQLTTSCGDVPPGTAKLSLYECECKLPRVSSLHRAQVFRTSFKALEEKVAEAILADQKTPPKEPAACQRGIFKRVRFARSAAASW